MFLSCYAIQHRYIIYSGFRLCVIKIDFDNIYFILIYQIKIIIQIASVVSKLGRFNFSATVELDSGEYRL